MGLITNGIILLVTLFTFNQIYAAIRRKVSKIPTVNSSWIDLVTAKPFRSILQGGYDRYSKASKSFLTSGGIYILPPSLFPEVRRLPSTVLHSSAANEDALYLARSLGDDYFDVIQFVRQNVVRSIADQVSPVRDEIIYQFSKHFINPDGSGDWWPVPIWATTFTMMTAISARFFVGSPLSRDEKFLAKIGDFTRAVSIEAVLMSQFPSWARAVVAKFLSSKKRVAAMKEMLRPHIEACLTETDDGKVVLRERESTAGEAFLYQFVGYVLPKYSDPTKTAAQMKQKILDEVTGRYLVLFFAAIDTTTMTFTQSCLDLVAHPRAQYADIIREEIESTLQRHNGQWNATAISELKHLDSFIHESQRLHPIGAALAARKVMTPGGWTFSNGDHVPQGSVVEFPIWFVQTDESVYEDANEFKGFRFVNDKHPESVPSDVFMAFGHGNHSCPGRRFALMEVKLMIIEFLTQYEYEELSERPADFLFGPGIIPDMKKEIRIRPKKLVF